jgi:DNA polymerase-4
VFVRVRARGQATILHADLDSFYASVEQRDDPALRGKPVLVGMGLVVAASYEAKAYGVSCPIGTSAAKRLCPDAISVPVRWEAYSEASSDVFEIFHDTSPAVEALSPDEAFLDAGGMERIAGTPRQIAERLRVRVREEVGLPITVGIASTKFLAKVASAVGKPDGLLEIPAGEELEFLHALPVERLWGVGPATSRKLHAYGIRRVAEVAALDEPTLVEMLGRAAGRKIHALAHNRDPRRVQARPRRRSIGAQNAFGWRPRERSEAELETVLVGLVDRVGRRMRKANRACRTVTLRLRFADLARVTRSRTLPEATAETPALLVAARTLFRDALPTIRQRGCTMVGITLSGLVDRDATQLALAFEDGGPRALDAALDGVRERFGTESITRAVLLGKEQGLTPPLLPDE